MSTIKAVRRKNKIVGYYRKEGKTTYHYNKSHKPTYKTVRY